jgi:hypothetical protein
MLDGQAEANFPLSERNDWSTRTHCSRIRDSGHLQFMVGTLTALTVAYIATTVPNVIDSIPLERSSGAQVLS